MRSFYVLLLALLHFPFFLKAQHAPLQFVQNQGQWKEPFLYKATSPEAEVYLEPTGFTYVIGAAGNHELIHAFKHNEVSAPPVLRYHAYKVSLIEANTGAIVTSSKKQPYYHNYFLGNDPDRWKSGIHPCLNVDYADIYPGVDLHVSSEHQQLKYDFIVAAGADPSRIRLRYEGLNRVSIKKGNLLLETSVGQVQELKPVVYQYIDNQRVDVPCDYDLDRSTNTLSYSFPEGYNKAYTLVIDPSVVFATFTGSTADNWGFTATYDPQGNFYAGGTVYSVGYPTTTGAFQTVFAGGGSGGGNGLLFDMGISKFTPNGTSLIYSTYIGGTDNEQPHSLIVDAQDNLVIAGRSYSSDFPVVNAFDPSHNGGADIVVAKLNPSGTGLLGATYIGGSLDDGVNISSIFTAVTGLKHNYGDDSRSEVITDNAGNIYVAASTTSTDFPVTANATQSSHQGQQDGVVFKLTPNLSTLTWSTYLGGTSDDAAYVLALSPNASRVYVAGGTASSNFPVTSATLWPSYMGGTADGFILRFQNSGSYNLERGTFIGQANYDQCYGIQVDNQNEVYAMGQTIGGTFPVTPGAYANPGSSQFVIKLDSNLSNIVYSTVFGSSNPNVTNISPVAFLVDTCEQVYISGWGGNLALNGGNTFNMPVTPDAAQSSTDGSDFYFIVFSRDVTSLLYATFYGGVGLGEHVDGGTSRFDRNGVVYQGICGGCGGSSSVPTTPGTHSPTNGSGNCNFLALKIAFELGSVSAVADVSPDTAGCPPFTVNFQNNSGNGITYEWDFGDGSPVDTNATPAPHTFTDPGVYTVRLIVKNPVACVATEDTAYLTIVVDTNEIRADFDYQVTDSCDPYIASFTNTSELGSGPNPGANATFTWNFGDGSPDFTGMNPGQHVFPDTGCYTVRLLIEDSTTCNKSSVIEKIVCIQSSRVIAAMTIPDSLCLGTPVLMVNDSWNYTAAHWDFGDGNTSTHPGPNYTYQQTGTFTVQLVASHPFTCNLSDTAYKQISIFSQPVAAFEHSPIIPEPNKEIQFTNYSQGAVTYRWTFGDGNGSQEEHPTHLYKKTGTYTVCLMVMNEIGCADTTCRRVDAEIFPAIDVPTGFSPNGDGNNDILYVRGAAIEKLNFKVYNRWGELVFETNDENVGWDGNYKGQPQEMESYAWILSARFVDGSSVERSGNVTLLR